jgi:protease-4
MRGRADREFDFEFILPGERVMGSPELPENEPRSDATRPDARQVVVPQVVTEPHASAAASRGGRLMFWILTLVGLSILAFIGMIFGSFVSAVSSSSESHVDEKYHSLNHHGRDKVAIITVEGTILHGEGFVKHQIDRVREDQKVKAIVLRVESPGGTVTGSDYIYHHLKKLAADRKLPLVVSMGSLAASGGYYVSMAVGNVENTIYAEPTTWTGSIGVMIPHYDASGLMSEVHVADDTIASHRLKTMGSFTKPMTEEERKIFQALVDDSFTRFKEIVKSGRPKFKDNDEALSKVATGQIFTTHQALASGLVDKEGFIEDAIDRAIELAGIDKANTEAVKYKQPFSLLDGLISAQSSKSNVSELSALMDLATPRAFYLFTWLPGSQPSAGNKP